MVTLQKSTGHRVHTWVRTSLVAIIGGSVLEGVSVLPPMDRCMFHLSRSCGFMCHGARQRLLRFDVCASVTFVFSSKHADGSMSVSDRRGKATRRRPMRSTERKHQRMTEAPELQTAATRTRRWTRATTNRERQHGREEKHLGDHRRCTTCSSQGTIARSRRSVGTHLW